MTLLMKIAHDMGDEARRRGVARRELGRGLAIELIHVAGYKTLHLSRPAVKPAEQEVGICRAAFHVPAEAVRNDRDVTVVLTWPSEL